MWRTTLGKAFAVRNMLAQITTDPGRNFIKAKSLFSSDYADTKLKNSIAEEICAAFSQVIWKILPPGSPWRSGRAEAMVKQVKHSLKCLPTKMLSLMEFCCVLQEITMTINNRPLGRFIGTNVLTPNMLIMGRNYSS